jgi:hypothetical protein
MTSGVTPHSRRLLDPRSAVAGPALLFAIFPAVLGHDWTRVDAQGTRGYVNCALAPSTGSPTPSVAQEFMESLAFGRAAKPGEIG